MTAVTEYTVQTPYGNISVWDTQAARPAAVFFHCNSGRKEVFQKQFESDLRKDFRLIGIDLPGHGNSENAKDPKTTYSLPGYADVAMEVFKQMNINHASIIGLSLGGHIAIDLLKRWPGVQGILITGTPPIPLTEEGFKQGFHPFPCAHLMSQETFTRDEAETFMSAGGLNIQEVEFLVQAALRTHGIARSQLITSMQEGIGGNQRKIVETTNKPVAVVCGKNDVGINNEYIQQVDFGNLWSGRVHMLDGGHVVLWENPQKFNEILLQFLHEMNA